MKVVWTPEAAQDRDDIWVHIAADNPRAAARMDELFSIAASRLADHPKLGRPGDVPGTRELIPHESYRLVYEIEGVRQKARLDPNTRDPNTRVTPTRVSP